MMKKIAKRLLRGSDEMVEKTANSFAKMTKKEFEDMKDANIGLYDMPHRLEK